MAYSDATADLRAALDAFNTRGIKHPQPVTDAVAVWQRVRSTRPETPNHYDLRDAVLAGADAAELGSILVAELGKTQIQTAWSQAEQFAAREALALIRTHRQHYLDALRPQFDALKANLETVAGFGQTTLDTLIRAGRNDDARLVADLETTATNLDALYRTRLQWLLPPGWTTLAVNGMDASRFENPADLHDTAAATLGQSFLDGIKQGGVLHWSSPERCRELAEALWADYEQEQRTIQQAQANVGGYASW